MVFCYHYQHLKSHAKTNRVTHKEKGSGILGDTLNNQTLIIEKTADFVKSKLEGEGSGHDWWHVYRVWKTAIKIAESEGANRSIVELGALLHDIADWKFHDGDVSIGASISTEWLHSLGVGEDIVQQVADIVKNISFKGAKVESRIKTLEGMVVQDADRLDAIGAIGIAEFLLTADIRAEKYIILT
jgi:uncharacterized protein